MSDRLPETISELLEEVRKTRDQLAEADKERIQKIARKADQSDLQKLNDFVVAKVRELQNATDQLSIKLGRPGGGALESGAASLRQNTRGLLELKHQSRVTKSAPNEPAFNPSESDLEEAEHAVKALRHLFKCTSLDQIPTLERKALTAFSVGASGFILQPELSDRILSCLTDVTDLSGLVGQITISSGSIKFMVDDVRLMRAAWACETSCAANNPPGQLTEGLGEVEIKAETLRYLVCASRDILEDAAVNVETWMMQKVQWAFRNTVSDAILAGTGVGMPLGLLNQAAGVPICDTGPNTPAGQFTWQDLYALAWQVPMQWHAGAVYVMNQRTFGMILTMSDAIGRPLMIANPTKPGEFLIAGFPVRIATQMPDIMPGSTPILFGNLQAAYLLVYRKQTTMLQDPFSFGYCIGFKFESRVGGSTICSNAARLLRIK
jgi:HK97 family phage major capsid protein